MTFDDPFSQFYHDIWAEVRTSASLKKLVGEGDMIELVSDRAELFFNPRASLSRVATRPVIILMPDTSEAMTIQDSASSSFQIMFNWNIYSPHYMLSPALLPILWQLYLAVRSGVRAARKFEWNGTRYVSNATTRFGDFNNPQFFAGNSGLPEIFAWRTSLDMEVSFSFDK